MPITPSARAARLLKRVDETTAVAYDALEPLERDAVALIYFERVPLSTAARRLGLSRTQLGRALASALRKIGAVL